MFVIRVVCQMSTSLYLSVILCAVIIVRANQVDMNLFILDTSSQQYVVAVSNIFFILAGMLEDDTNCSLVSAACLDSRQSSDWVATLHWTQIDTGTYRLYCLTGGGTQCLNY